MPAKHDMTLNMPLQEERKNCEKNFSELGEEI